MIVERTRKMMRMRMDLRHYPSPQQQCQQLLLLCIALISSLFIASVAANTTSMPSKTSKLSPTLITPSPSTNTTMWQDGNNDDVQSLTIPRKMLSSFGKKFEVVGPTLTLSLRDPTSMTLLRSHKYDSNYYDNTVRSSVRKRRRESIPTDDGTFGISSKVAALFHISPSKSTIEPNNRETHSFSFANGVSSSTSSSTKFSSSSSQLDNRYMLDNGDLLLDQLPLSSSSIDGVTTTPSSLSNGIFSVRPHNIRKIFWNKKRLDKQPSSWEYCVRNVHPELKFELRTKRQSSTISSTAINSASSPISLSSSQIDTTTSSSSPLHHTGEKATQIIRSMEFPKTASWISALSLGVVWRPFSSHHHYHTHEEEEEDGYHIPIHRIFHSARPNYVRARAKISVPRLSRLLMRRGSSHPKSLALINDESYADDSNLGDMNVISRDSRKEVDLSFTYQKRKFPTPTGGDGIVELALGAPSAIFEKNDNNDSIQANNHILVRLATGKKTSAATKTNRGNQNSIGTTNAGSTATTTSIPSFLSTDSSSSTTTNVELVKGSFDVRNPLFVRNKTFVSISPSFDFVDGAARVVFSGQVGSSGTTRAVLRLDSHDESTLTLVRTLNENKIIAPTISLHSGKIVYDYYLNLDRNNIDRWTRTSDSRNRRVNSSIRAHVDPTSGITIKWTDGMQCSDDTREEGGSCWVTECTIPLGTCGPGPLAADVRVGRRWVIG